MRPYDKRRSFRHNALTGATIRTKSARSASRCTAHRSAIEEVRPTGFEPVTLGSEDYQRIPATSLSSNDLGEQPSGRAANGECGRVRTCQGGAPSDATPLPAITFIAAAWPRLKPHVREAILTLVSAGLCTEEVRSG